MFSNYSVLWALIEGGIFPLLKHNGWTAGQAVTLVCRLTGSVLVYLLLRCMDSGGVRGNTSPPRRPPQSRPARPLVQSGDHEAPLHILLLWHVAGTEYDVY